MSSKPSRITLAVIIMAACPGVLCSIGALGQDAWPSKPVKLVVPFVPATPADELARLVGQFLSDQWHRPVLVENKPGATGSIGSDAVAKAPPDGYTLLVTADFSLTMYPAVASNLPYNPVTDFKPIATIAYSDNGVFVNAAVPARSLQELIALAKSQPGKLTYASSGVASPSHFAAEQFMAVTGTSMLHVPYKGGTLGMTALIAGEVSLAFASIPQALPQVRAGKIRALAVSSSKPSPLLPDQKTLVELGFPGLVFTNWFPVLAPAKTPDAITDTIRVGLRNAIQDPQIRTRLEASGLTPAWEGPEQVTALIAADIKRWADTAKRASIKLQ